MTQTSQPAITVTITTPSDCEVLVTRQFNAPRSLVFDAVTKADLIKRWYGPGGASMESCESDARPGGSFRFVTNAGGRQMVMFGVYTEMDAPRRFVRSQRWEGWDDRETLMTVELAEHDGKTTMTQRFVFPSKEMRDQVMKAGMTPQGMSAFYERLDTLLAGR